MLTVTKPGHCLVRLKGKLMQPHHLSNERWKDNPSAQVVTIVSAHGLNKAALEGKDALVLCKWVVEKVSEEDKDLRIIQLRDIACIV